MKIFLVRHGADEEGFRGGWSKRGLIEQGVLQSRRLGEYLHRYQDEYGIRTMMSSDLTRAVETTREMERSFNQEAIYSQDWREMNNGYLAGMPNQEADTRYPGVYFNTLGMDAPFPGGETPKHFYNRITKAFESLCMKLECQEVKSNVLLVTHGGVVNVLYYHLNGQEWTNKSPFFPIDNTSVHTVEMISDQWKVTEKNSMKHL